VELEVSLLRFSEKETNITKVGKRFTTRMIGRSGGMIM
jgi:hypothetical protein